MAPCIVKVEIVGVTPLLVNRFAEPAEVDGAKPGRKMLITRDPRGEATKAAYIDPRTKTFYFNAMSIPGCMGGAGANHKMRGSRKSMRFVVPSAVTTLVDGITILDGKFKPAKDFEVDARPVTIPSTKGKIMRYRPRWDEWSARFDLSIESDILTVEDSHMLLTEAGTIIGIGDFRPEKRGPFGRFRVTNFKKLSM